MARTTNSALVLTGMLCLCSGCTHFIEARPIELFANALAEEDLKQLRSSTSGEFQQKALRLAEALDDFKILRLPEGKTTIAQVEDVSPSKKRVTVEVGETKRKLLYELTLDSETEKWVVDDVYVKQKRKGMTAAKSVTQQMDLLLTVREFLSAWDEGERDDVLAVTTPEFARLLSELPPAHLARLTKRVIGESSTGRKPKPEAQMGESFAIVRLPRAAGEVVLSFSLHDDKWRIRDLAVESVADHEHIASVRKLAAVTGTS